MAQTEVSSVIRDIIDAFKNGSSVFKRGRGRKHNRQSSQSALPEEDKRVHNSLSQRPQQIQQSYDQSVAKHGRRFEVGDTTSQTSLAQILLVLNTGLIKLLNQALSRDSKSRGQSRNEILSLSESAAMDTLHALSELNTRLTSVSKLDLRIPRTIKEQSSHDQDPKLGNTSGGASPSARNASHTRQRSSSSLQQPKRPQVSPRLANGGWVRSKSDPSIVSVVTSNKVTNKNDRKRPSAPRSSSSNSVGKKTTQPVHDPLPEALPSDPTPDSKVERAQCFPDVSKQSGMTPETRIRRQPSMYIVPSDFFDAFPTIAKPRYELQTIEEPVASEDFTASLTNELFSHNVTFGGRARPPSMMTFKTVSTKIGEIPDHKLPDRFLTEEQRFNLPMPYVVPEMLRQPVRKKRGFKFWRKQTGTQQALAA